MSILGCLVAGLLMILLWFEISSTFKASTMRSVHFSPLSVATQGMELQARVAFILAAVTETILFAASILGFVEPFDLNQINILF